jgi:hypothetical protein
VITAVFSDVHGNLPALRAIIDDVAGRAASYVCLGDTVNYGPWNDECLELVDRLPGSVVLEGNHERLFLDGRGPELDNPLVELFTRASLASFSRRDLISSLPTTFQLGSYTCCHTINGARIFPDSPIQVQQDWVIGHSHHQFIRRVDGHLLVNPGSVGQSRRPGTGGNAYYAMFDSDCDSWTLNTVPYDVDAFIAELTRRGYPQLCIDYVVGKQPRQS